jgi:hypothetical protein
MCGVPFSSGLARVAGFISVCGQIWFTLKFWFKIFEPKGKNLAGYRAKLRLNSYSHAISGYFPFSL